MTVSADTLRRLAALKLPSEAFQEVLLILAEMQGADDARRRKDRERKSKPKSTETPGSGHGNSTETTVENSPHTPLKKENKIPEPSGSGATQAELERDLFRRGRQICGKSSGGLINSLLKAKQHDVSLARSVLELASTKLDPREFVAAATRSKGNGAGSSTMAAFDKLIAGTEGGDVPRGADMRDVTPRGS